VNVLITGGAGFIGQRVAAAMLERGSLPDAENNEVPITRIRISDIAQPLTAIADDERIETVIGDFTAAGAAEELLGTDTDVIIHLAAVVSGQAEANFDLGMRINLDGTRGLLDACRALAKAPRLVFTSSVAAFGGDMPEVLDDRTHLTAQNSYGIQKTICELLINDYTRKGFIDGRSLRLPTVVVRPGKANAAASSFASAVIREPLQGSDYACPVKADTSMWLMSPRKVVDALIHGTVMPASVFAGGFRSVSLPGLTVTIEQMVDAMRTEAGDEVADRVSFMPDPMIEQIVYGWPTRFATPRAEAMGFTADSDFRDVVKAFIEDDLQ
jgi:nucleoside-diphosphate-sugar epimerase